MQNEYGIFNPLRDLQAPNAGQVAQLRAEHGLTQESAGALIGIDRKDWSRYECGARSMSAASWACLLLTLGAHPHLQVTLRPTVV